MTTAVKTSWPLSKRPAVIGMIHVGALPATPRSRQGLGAIVDAAVVEARLLAEGGFDAVLIENMHDVPYLNREVGPEVVAGMAAVACAVRAAVDVPIGVQVLAGANRAALAVALACGGTFVRAEGFVFAHVADEGVMSLADAGPLLRYRRAIGAEAVGVWSDVKKKHSSHAITADLDIAETARAAVFSGADAVIVTGGETGAAASLDEVRDVRQAVQVPVVVGSGMTVDNLEDYWGTADAFIVGSSLKSGGDWKQTLDADRVRAFAERVASLRS